MDLYALPKGPCFTSDLAIESIRSQDQPRSNFRALFVKNDMVKKKRQLLTPHLTSSLHFIHSHSPHFAQMSQIVLLHRLALGSPTIDNMYMYM